MDNYYIKPYEDTYFFFLIIKVVNLILERILQMHLIKLLKKLFKKNSKNYTSHSLKYAYISGLCYSRYRICKAIEHSSIQTTSRYTKQLTDKEMEKRMNNIPIN